MNTERRREEILRAALRAFRDRGYHATTLDCIAEHLGVRETARCNGRLTTTRRGDTAVSSAAVA